MKVVEETPGISEGRGLESRPRHLYEVFAEIVHARNHHRSLGEIKGTTDNLQMCIDGEHYEVNEMCPAFNNVAKIQDGKEVERDTYYALEAEKTHEILYTKAKELAEQRKDIDEKRFSICPVCGHTVVGEPPNAVQYAALPTTSF